MDGLKCRAFRKTRGFVFNSRWNICIVSEGGFQGRRVGLKHSSSAIHSDLPITHKLTRAQEQRRVQKVYSQRETQVTKFNSLRWICQKFQILIKKTVKTHGIFLILKIWGLKIWLLFGLIFVVGFFLFNVESAFLMDLNIRIHQM